MLNSNRSVRTSRKVGAKEKWLTILVVVLVVCVLALVIAVIVLALQEHTTPKPEQSCMKKECIQISANIMNKIDENEKPCDNFWKFACGNFIESNPVFPFQNTTQYSVFGNIHKKVTTRLIELLTEENKKDTISPIKKVKKLFNTCLTTDMDDEKHLKQVVVKAADFGGVPFITGDMNESSTRLQLLIQYADYISTFTFFGFGVIRNVISGKGNILYVHMLKPQNTAAITTVIEAVANELNKSSINNMSSIYNITEIKSFMDTYNEIAATQQPFSLENFDKWELKNISEISKSFPAFDMETYINGILEIGGTKLQNDSNIVIADEEQIQNLTRLINETSLETLLNIMAAASINEIQLGLGTVSVSNKIHGENLNTDKTRVNTCLKLCTQLAPRVLGKMYVQEYFPTKNRNKAIELTKYLGKALITVLEDNTWLDKESKESVLKKAKALIDARNVGYDPSLISDEYLIKRFENVNVSDNIINNVYEFSRALIKRTLKSFSSDHGKDQSVMNSFEVNAVYNPFYNELTIPASILQPPLFDMDTPEAINFGGVGTIIGHEMMHGFDNTGIQFNENGNFAKILTNSSLQKFNEMRDKVIDEYSKFRMPGMNETVNGSLTVGENLSDLSGIKISYMAYKLWKEDNTESKLPGLSLTNDQLFFSSFTQVWCENKSPELLRVQLKTDVHSPALARSIVTLRNTQEFSYAYHCSENSPMNPSQKINIW